MFTVDVDFSPPLSPEFSYLGAGWAFVVGVNWAALVRISIVFVF
jgi:hypothetical protein